MTQIVLAAVLTGYLAVTPAIKASRNVRRIEPASSGRAAFDESNIVRVPTRCVLILDQPLEPSFAYLRVDNAVYALRLSA